MAAAHRWVRTLVYSFPAAALADGTIRPKVLAKVKLASLRVARREAAKIRREFLEYFPKRSRKTRVRRRREREKVEQKSEIRR